MNMSGTLADTPYAGGIVARSDHMPSKLERHADWARKFYGGGCHESNVDSRESVEHVARTPLAAPAFAH